jgi:hypothetical protein
VETRDDETIRQTRVFATVLLGAALAALATRGNGHSTRTGARAKAREAADLVMLHGDVYTVDPARPVAQAVAVAKGKILAVGSDAAIEKYVGPKTRVIDLGGRFAISGFNDAHTHLASAGAAKIEVNLRSRSRKGVRGAAPVFCLLYGSGIVFDFAGQREVWTMRSVLCRSAGYPLVTCYTTYVGYSFKCAVPQKPLGFLARPTAREVYT